MLWTDEETQDKIQKKEKEQLEIVCKNGKNGKGKKQNNYFLLL